MVKIPDKFLIYTSMGIFNFKQFSTNEKLGISESSLIFVDLLKNRIYEDFIDFLESDDSKLEKTDVIKYRTLKPYIDDIQLYGDFPVVGFEIDLEFDKISDAVFKRRFPESYKKGVIVAAGGSATGFGHKNWKHYSKIVKPVKMISNVGLIIKIGIELLINSDLFDIENKEHSDLLEDNIGSTLYHELNHSYEHYKRTTRATKPGDYTKPLYDRSFSTAITYAENNIWRVPKPIWKFWSNNFLYYTYMSESFELNSNVQEMYYHLQKYPDKNLNEFEIYKNANTMEKFDSDDFYNQLTDLIEANGGDEHEIADKLKNMWVSVYIKELKNQKATPIIPIETLNKMKCSDFIKWWGEKFNKNGKYLKRKIHAMKNELSK